MKYIIILTRSFFFYILIGVLYRLMGKREVAELSIMDLVVSIFIAQIASIAIENYDKSIFISIVPISILVSLQILTSILELKFSKAREIIDGKSSVLINKGKINYKEMKKQRYNIDDLLVQLREQSIKSLDEVDFAILETDGKISVFKRQDDPNRDFPLPVIIDGKADEKTLKYINKNVRWLENELNKDKLKIEDIFYAFYKNKELYLIEQSKIK